VVEKNDSGFQRVLKGNDLGVYELILERRTIRKFQDKPVPEQLLKKIVNAGRLAPSGSNLQPLEFIVINKASLLGKIFATLKWAGYIAPEGNPPEGAQPQAYIVVLINSDIKKENGETDAAAAIENMILAALDENVASCWIGSVNRAELRKIFDIPRNYKINAVLALGYPDEKPVVVEAAEDSIKYWKDEKGVLHVPKRRLSDLIHYNKF